MSYNAQASVFLSTDSVISKIMLVHSMFIFSKEILQQSWPDVRYADVEFFEAKDI